MAKGVLLAVSIAVMLGASAPAEAQFLGDASPAPTSQMKPIQLAQMVLKIKRGDPLGQISANFCLLGTKIYMEDGLAAPLPLDEFDDIFRTEMRNAGYVLAGKGDNLFEQSSDLVANYLVGGRITRVNVNICYANYTPNSPDFSRSSGSAAIDVEWQLFSTLERKVVGTVKITGNAAKVKNKAGGAWAVLYAAFADSVRQLSANPQLRKVLSAPALTQTVERTSTLPLQIRTAAITPATVAEAVASTALIIAPSGEGSGFLISPEGYLLTNQHVVGTSQQVKVRWADGKEVPGEVIRRDAARDVAVIRAEGGARKPLRLRSQPVAIGEDVFAIGAPTGRDFQNSVTKGIISARRIMDGLNYIQSDVAVTHGNSGGPVVDSKGQVVAITVSGLENAAMLNFFIPIADAPDFLGLQMLPPTK